MFAYVPKFHDRVDRALSRALNGVTVLSEIRAAVVTTLPAAVDNVSKNVTGIHDVVKTIPTKIDGANDTLAKINDKLNTETVPHDIDGSVAPVLRILIAAQGIALDATPMETVDGKQKSTTKNNAAMRALRDSEAINSAKTWLSESQLLGEVEHALLDFDNGTLRYRSERWSKMLSLCATIAAVHVPDTTKKA